MLREQSLNHQTAASMNPKHLFKWRHFLPEVILQHVRWYCRYALSYRDFEEMMREREDQSP